MIIDGIAASSAIDSSGEIVSIEGMDISDCLEGKCYINFEHKSQADDLVGIVTFAKKIFSKKDCDNKRELMFWEKTKLPFLYIQARLFDEEGHPGAVCLAAIMRAFQSKKEMIKIGYSVEGSTLSRSGNKLEKTVIRKISATVRPCNKQAWADILDNSDEFEKSELTGKHYIFTETDSPIYQDSVQKNDPVSELKLALETLQKTLTAGMGNAAPGCLTGGAALTKEHLSPTVKNTLKAAIRDWNRVRPLKEVIKAALPEVSDKYVDHFTQIAEDLALKKGMNPKLIRVGKNHSVHEFDTDEQKELIDGAFFDPNKNFRPERGSSQFHISQNDAGDSVLFKRKNYFGPKNSNTEAIYYNLAKNVFGMHNHVLPVTTISHPNIHNGEPVTVSKYHKDCISPIADKESFKKAINKGREDGSLHKITIMDLILGNKDRNIHNILIDKSGKLLNIDHEYSLDEKFAGDIKHHFFFQHDPLFKNPIDNPANDNLHVEANRWLQGIDKKKLVREIAKYGLGKDALKTSVARLKLLQLMASKGARIGDMIHAINHSGGTHA